jgi:hypothetical protein
MLPVSYLSRSRGDDDYLISKRMKKFYKSPELGENKKIPSNIKNKGSDIYDTTYDRDSYNVENLFDSNGEIENPDINVQYELKKKYNPLVTSSRNVKYPFSEAVFKHRQHDIDLLDEIGFEKKSDDRNKDIIIELCIYHININAHKPFLEFMLYKSNDNNIMYFPSFVYDDTVDSILEKSENIIDNILLEKGSFEFKGRITPSEIENNIQDADIDSRIILLFEIKQTNLDVVHMTNHQHFWWATVSEIFNYKKVMFYEISNTLTDVFLSCVDMIKIYYKRSLIETPGIFYNGNNKNVTKYNAILSLNKAPTESRYGPYYYFTDLHTAMKYACYGADGKKRSSVDGAGFVRFVVFHGKMKMFMKKDKIDDSKMATYIFERYPVEKKTGQFRDNDCKWTDNYNSVYNGYHDIQYYTRKNSKSQRDNHIDSHTDTDTDTSDDNNNSNDSEENYEEKYEDNYDDKNDLGVYLKKTLESETYIKTKKKRVTIFLAMRLCIDEYSFQTPISYHYIDIKADDIPEVYDFNFKQYKLL